MDFRVLVPGEAHGLECRMLSCFIKEGQKPLLKHPLCETLLFLKWLKVRSFFVFNLIFYALLVILLTTYIMVVFPAFSCYHLNSTSEETIYAPFQFSPSPTPLDHVLPSAKPTTPPGYAPYLLGPEDSHHETHTTFGQSEKVSKRERCGLLYESLFTYLLYTIWSGVSLLAVKEVFQIINAPRTYLSWDNVFIWPIIIFTMTITITSYVRHDTEDWEHHLAAVVILLSWVELLFIIGRFPVFGLYVQMFTHVTRNFGKFLFAYICLINAFSLSFGVLFPNHPPFKTIGLRLLKTMVMMTGEIEYDEWFFDEKTIMYPATSYIIFSVFLIFVTIILMNLLVGLAVSDIQGLLKSVGLDRLVRQTQLVVHFETFMFSKWLALVVPRGVLRLLHHSILLFPSLYGCTLILSPKTLRDTGIPPELVEVIMHTARARDHISRRRNAFANFRTLSKTAQYSSSEGDIQRSVEALRFGLDLLVWDVDERRNDARYLKESLAALTEEVARVGHCVEELAGGAMSGTREDSVYASCSSIDASRSSTPSLS